jgi:hypothetical protein
MELIKYYIVGQELVPLATSMLRKPYATVRSLLAYFNKVRKYLDPTFIDFDRNILIQADHDIWVSNSVKNDTIIQFRAFQHLSPFQCGREELLYTKSEMMVYCSGAPQKFQNCNTYSLKLLLATPLATYNTF